MKILITGISGTLARGVAYRLVRRGYEVVGIDRRPWPDVPEGVEMHQADIRKRPAEDVFRISRPDALIHMATVTHFTTSTEERYRINLGGTRKLFEYCHEYGVKQAVFVGRHTVYGATPDSPLYHTEDEPPLAGAAFKELADLVAADLYAGSALWRWPELNTAVLRLCYFLGPSRGGTLAGFLSKSRVPMVLGFDPLYQLMHEWDAEEAITLAVEKQLRGVFNVAGPRTGASVRRLFRHRQAGSADPRAALLERPRPLRLSVPPRRRSRPREVPHRHRQQGVRRSHGLRTPLQRQADDGGLQVELRLSLASTSRAD